VGFLQGHIREPDSFSDCSLELGSLQHLVTPLCRARTELLRNGFPSRSVEAKCHMAGPPWECRLLMAAPPLPASCPDQMPNAPICISSADPSLRVTTPHFGPNSAVHGQARGALEACSHPPRPLKSSLDAPLQMDRGLAARPRSPSSAQKRVQIPPSPRPSP
jgi:hypothetical protein